MENKAYDLFSQKTIEELAKKHTSTFKMLRDVENSLQKKYYKMNVPIRAVILAAAAGESLLLIGPPGTAKSSLIGSFTRALGIDRSDSDDHSYFEYLLTQFTEPSELFGYYDMTEAINNSKLTRMTDGMITEAQVVYLDEVFNASSAILNSLLAMINERYYHERGEVKHVKLDVLYGATNDIPSGGELTALFDRFLLRCHVDNAKPESAEINDLIRSAWRVTYQEQNRLNLPPDERLKPKIADSNGDGRYKDLLDHLREFRRDVDLANGKMFTITSASPGSASFYTLLAQYTANLRKYHLASMSNRRTLKFVYILLVNLVYLVATGSRSEAKIMGSDLALLRYMVDVKQIPDVHEDKLEALIVPSWE